MRFLVPTAVSVVSVMLLALGGCGGGVAIDPLDGGTETGETSVVVDSGSQPDTRPVQPDARPDTNTPDPDDAIVIEEDSGPACNTLVNTGSLVTGTVVEGSAPPTIGGTIVPGNYHLTAMTYYRTSGPSLPTFSTKITFQFTGSTIQTASDSSTESDRSTATYTLAGNTLNLSQSCPAPESAVMGYSATATSIVLHFPIMESGLNGTLRYSLTKF
jgi:hypothetical protein